MTTIGIFAAIFDDEGRILCVKRNYGPRNWTTPGGLLEVNESPLDALVREVREETGFVVRPGHLIGVYSAPFKDDVVLFLTADVMGHEPWEPDEEIADVGFFAPDALPDMGERTLTRIHDAFAGCQGVMHVFDLPG